MLSQLAVGRLAGVKLPLSRNCRIGAVSLQKSCKPPAPISWLDYERHADPSAPATLTLDQPRDDGSVVSSSTCRPPNAFGWLSTVIKHRQRTGAARLSRWDRRIHSPATADRNARAASSRCTRCETARAAAGSG